MPSQTPRETGLSAGLISGAFPYMGRVLFRPLQPTAENGDIVAAMLDGEATVKTFKRRDGHIWLMPHNPAYEPIPGDDASILGRVVSVLRRV